MLSKKITIKTNLSFREVLVILKKGISDDYFLSAGKVMSGYIHGTKINGAINPPGLMSDAFKTIVKGNIISENRKIELHFELSFSIISKIVLLIWYLFAFAILITLEYHDLSNFPKEFGVILLMSFLPSTLLWLKLIWDKNRLEEWLKQNFKE